MVALTLGDQSRLRVGNNKRCALFNGVPITDPPSASSYRDGLLYLLKTNQALKFSSFNAKYPKDRRHMRWAGVTVAL